MFWPKLWQYNFSAIDKNTSSNNDSFNCHLLCQFYFFIVRKVIPEVMSRFSEDNNQQMKDMIRESTETRRQRILKKLKDRIASSLFTP